MTYPKERARADRAHIARCLWRADLLDYSAAGLCAFGDTASAERKIGEAELHRLEASNAQALLDAQTSGDRDAVLDAQRDCRDARRVWRQIGEYVGTAGVATVNNFAEPSDDELLKAVTR